MSDYDFATEEILYLRKKGKISEKLFIFLQNKLNQKDDFIISLFKTLKWSLNEQAVFEKIQQIPLENNQTSNLSTETSLKNKSRPSPVIVPFNRTIDFYANEKNFFPFYENKFVKRVAPSQNKHTEKLNKSKKIILPKMKCSYNLKFDSDISDEEESNKALSPSLNDLELNSPNSETREKKPFTSITNFTIERKGNRSDETNSIEKLMETKMSIEEILEKYQKEIDNGNQEEIKETESNNINDSEEFSECEALVPTIGRRV